MGALFIKKSLRGCAGISFEKRNLSLAEQNADFSLANQIVQMNSIRHAAHRLFCRF
jgi:hypothetical protein